MLPELKDSVPLTSLSPVLYNSATGVGLYQQRIDAQFSSGDMIGFTQSESDMSSVVLRYIENTGETIVVDESPQSLVMLPLVAVDTGKMKEDDDDDYIEQAVIVCVWLQIIVSVGLHLPVERVWSMQWVSIWPLREAHCSKTAQ